PEEPPMTRKIVSHLALTAALILAAVAGLLIAAPAGAAPGPLFAYVHLNGSPNRVLAFQVGTDGSLTELSGSPFATGDGNSGCNGQCQTLAFSAAKDLLFASGGSGVTPFHVAADGSLTRVSG